MPLSIATWNVNSVSARLPLVLQWIENQKPDILCLQEIKCVDEKFPVEAFTKAGYHSLVFGQPTYNGVAILVKNELVPQIGEVQKGFGDEEAAAPRRLLAAEVAGVRVVNVYIPNGQAVGSDKYAYKLDWLGKLRKFLETKGDPTQKLLLCGDFNVAPDDIDVYDPAAWQGKVLFSPPEKQALSQVKAWGLEDAFRKLYPDLVAYSWWDYRQASFRRNLGLRIDHIWVTPTLLQLCQQVTIDTQPRGWERPSDHTPVLGTFNIEASVKTD